MKSCSRILGGMQSQQNNFEHLRKQNALIYIGGRFTSFSTGYFSLLLLHSCSFDAMRHAALLFIDHVLISIYGSRIHLAEFTRYWHVRKNIVKKQTLPMRGSESIHWPISHRVAACSSMVKNQREHLSVVNNQSRLHGIYSLFSLRVLVCFTFVKLALDQINIFGVWTRSHSTGKFVLSSQYSTNEVSLKI